MAVLLDYATSSSATLVSALNSPNLYPTHPLSPRPHPSRTRSRSRSHSRSRARLLASPLRPAVKPAARPPQPASPKVKVAPAVAPVEQLARDPSKKRVAIVGAGTGGLGALIALLDLPEEMRRGWTIELLERREDVGGIWLPDDNQHDAGSLPATPLYPALHTNTPVPTMTFPNFPFPPNTPLFPSHTHVRSYLSRAVSHFKLASFLRLNTSVARAAWDAQNGEWDVELEVHGKPERRRYDSLVVATGRYHHPAVPSWVGQQEWLEAGAGGTRTIQHSLWYRGPEAYRDAVVVVVGFGASGWDAAQQTVLVAKQVYHSYTVHPGAPVKLPPVPGTTHKPRISHFSPSAIHFVDGSTLPTPRETPIRLILATGYSLSIPFLSPHLLEQRTLDPAHPRPPHNLETNGACLRPLWRDVLAVPVGLPPTALGVVGLPWFVAAAQASYIQGLVLAHALAAPSANEGRVLGRSAQQMRDEVDRAEETRRKEEGVEPFVVGHKFTEPGQAESYQDALLSLLRSSSPVALPDHLGPSNTPFVSPWRRRFRGSIVALRRAFLRAVEEGKEEEFRASGSGSEEEWVEAMERLERWLIERMEVDEVEERRTERGQGVGLLREEGGLGTSGAAAEFYGLEGLEVRMEGVSDI
ncbi:hypothetical protein JCM9279_002380 [Rhodotorula babjevae]